MLIVFLFFSCAVVWLLWLGQQVVGVFGFRVLEEWVVTADCSFMCVFVILVG
jgi:hypothetical protein